jgi:uncharacterized protein (DUF433 family)
MRGDVRIAYMTTRQPPAMENLDDGSRVIEGVIWIHPDRVSGVPCFINTRVPIQNLFDYLEGGETLEEFLDGFPPITRDQAIKVLELARTGLFDSLPRSENPTRP